MFVGAKIGKNKIRCKEKCIFFKKNKWCRFYVCQINLPKFNTSWMNILGFQERKKGVKMAGESFAISKTMVCSKQNGLLLGAKRPFTISRMAFCDKQTGRLLTSNRAFLRVETMVEIDLKMEPLEYQ